jgi:hypothetical protein
MTTAKEPPNSAVPPPCSAEHPQHQDSSKDSTNNFKHSRCQFTYSDGRRCGNERASLCVYHGTKEREARTKAAPDAMLNAPELVTLCSDLTTATNINRALAQVFLLTAQGRISQKQAVAFGYLSQLLLQTVPGIRSEFVSAFGYAPWETKLKASLESNLTMRPASSSRATNRSEGSLSDSPSAPDGNPGLTSEKDESEPAAPLSAPVNKARLSAQSLRDGLTPDDWESLYHRGRDLLAGKYSVTPEGRREAQALDTDLELIKPPAAKMPKGARASVIEHMKRWIAQRKAPTANSSPPASIPPALNLLGHPIPMAAPYDKMKSPVAPVTIPAPRPPAVSSDPPPSHDPKKPPTSAHLPAPEPSACPGPSTFARELDPTPTNTTAHTTAWYAPASWSKNRTPDPFPSRNEKLQRGGRGVSNSKSRHLQHLNSRAF